MAKFASVQNEGKSKELQHFGHSYLMVSLVDFLLSWNVNSQLGGHVCSRFVSMR